MQKSKIALAVRRADQSRRLPEAVGASEIWCDIEKIHNETTISPAGTGAGWLQLAAAQLASVIIAHPMWSASAARSSNSHPESLGLLAVLVLRALITLDSLSFYLVDVKVFVH